MTRSGPFPRPRSGLLVPGQAARLPTLRSDLMLPCAAGVERREPRSISCRGGGGARTLLRREPMEDPPTEPEQ